MTEPAHGTRARYRRGCRCLPCRSANAIYQQRYRLARQHGRRPLGARISAVETWRRIRQLKAERLTQAEIARRLGLKRPLLQLDTDVVTLRNAIKIRRLHRQLILEGADGPDTPIDSQGPHT